jgi:hypothetical protein
VGTRYFYGPLARALVAYQDGDAERATQCLQQVRAEMPHLVGEPRLALERAGFCPSIAERFVSDLRHAGLAAAPASAASAE